MSCYPFIYQVALCRHGLARPQVADGGDSLQVLRIAADILSNQYRMEGGGLGDWQKLPVKE